MSDDFRDRIRRMKAAYGEQLAANQRFEVEWFRLSKEIIEPVLTVARADMALRPEVLKIAKEPDNGISFVVKATGQNNGRLTYRPDAESRKVKIITGRGDTDEQDGAQYLPLDAITTELIESHVENFLKDALLRRPLGD